MPVLAVLLLLVLGLAASGPAWPAPPERGVLVAQAEGVQPLGAVLRRIGERFPGRALDAQTTEREGRPIYRIKWLGNDGKVRDITVDARSGQILQVR